MSEMWSMEFDLYLTWNIHLNQSSNILTCNVQSVLLGLQPTSKCATNAS